MKRSLVQTGSSLAVTLPIDVVQAFGLRKGQDVDLTVHPISGAITIRPGIAWLERGQVSALFGRRVSSFVQTGGVLTGLRFEDRDELRVDAAIVAAGPQIGSLISDLPEARDIRPVRGYSLTIPRTGLAPSISLTDVQRKLAFAAIGDRFRVAGLADIERPGAGFDARRFDTLKLAASAVLPDLFERSDELMRWSGERPMTPTSKPIIAASRRIKGLYINAGHGMVTAGGIVLISSCRSRKRRSSFPVAAGCRSAPIRQSPRIRPGMRAPVASAIVGSRSTSIWKSMISRLSASVPSARRSSSPIEMSIAFSSAPYPPAALGTGGTSGRSEEGDFGSSARKAGPDAMPGDALFAFSLSGSAMFLFLIEVALDEFL